MNCKSCYDEVLSSWKFCPKCGLQLSKAPTLPLKASESSAEVIPNRLQELIQDYETLTGSALNKEIIQDFLNHSAVRSLSVIDRDRRLRSGRQVRQKLNKGLFSIELQAWLNHIYENPLKARTTRVWITTRGDKYHLDRDCRGLVSGQNYARFFGKDTYNPQFEEIHYAAFVLGKFPCNICKPPIYKKP
jgi:hypothetical protein